MPRKPIVGGNWKCNPAKPSDLDALVANINACDTSKCEVYVCPSNLHVGIVFEKFKPGIMVAPQNCNFKGCGAFTGEMAVDQMREMGIKACLIGHSERRGEFGLLTPAESNKLLATKLKYILDAGMMCIFAIGEPLPVRTKGIEAVVDYCKAQLEDIVGILKGLEDKSRVVIAYEPVWSIGTGVTASPAQAQETHAAIRAYLKKACDEKTADDIRIQYGGSANAKNAPELSACPDVDGFLVGGASLKPEFKDIVAAISEAKVFLCTMSEPVARQTRKSTVVFLWSHPRALSTAMLRSLAELSHATTVMEPFMIPWQAEIGVLNREKYPNPPSYDDIVNLIEIGDYYTEGHQYIQIIKEMPVHFSSQLLETIFERFPRAYHVFLVRHPYQMIPSYFKVPEVSTYTEDVIEMDVAYKPLLDLAETISTQGTVLLLDAESLLANPRKSLTRLCNHIETEFEDSLLTWKPHEIPRSWRDLEAFDGWLDNVISSSGWNPKSADVAPSYPEVQSEFQKKCIDINIVIYEQLMQKFSPPDHD